MSPDARFVFSDPSHRSQDLTRLLPQEITTPLPEPDPLSNAHPRSWIPTTSLVTFPAGIVLSFVMTVLLAVVPQGTLPSRSRLHHLSRRPRHHFGPRLSRRSRSPGSFRANHQQLTQIIVPLSSFVSQLLQASVSQRKNLVPLYPGRLLSYFQNRTSPVSSGEEPERLLASFERILPAWYLKPLAMPRLSSPSAGTSNHSKIVLIHPLSAWF